MDFLEQLKAQKQAGQEEHRAKLNEQQQRERDEAARLQAQREAEREAISDAQRKKANLIYSTIPGLVRMAASSGMPYAVLDEGMVSDEAPGQEPHRKIVVDRRTYFLTGWQVPFYEKCKDDAIPLTVVSEESSGGLLGIRKKTFHFLAVDVAKI
jgi:hypothetical protein